MTARSCFAVCTVFAVAAFALGGCRSDGPAVAASGPAVADSVTQPASSPRAAIDRFLQFYFHEYRSGLPSERERAALSPMVTRGFSAALEAAAHAERCAYGKHQGTEPPLIQGDLFSSLFEKANAVLGINEDSNDGATAEYTLDFEYRTPGDPGQVSKWHDGVHLVRIDGAWLIDDFMHRGEWQFTSQGSVKSLLTATADLCVER